MGKKLHRAPVYFVIAQVQFNQFMALDTYAPLVQDRFRKVGYPDAEIVRVPVFDVAFGASGSLPPPAKQSEITQYSFFNIERTESFVLSNDRLSFQTTHYDVFEGFSRKFIGGLKLVNEVMGLSLTVRTGLRYLDAVVPDDREALSKYIDPHLLGLTEKSLGAVRHSFFETIYARDQVSITSRAITVSGKLAVPPDIQPITLRLVDRFAAVQGLHTVLDNDGSITQRSPFSVESIEQQLDQIHAEITRVFQVTVTSAAIESWQ